MKTIMIPMLRFFFSRLNVKPMYIEGYMYQNFKVFHEIKHYFKIIDN